MIKSERERVIVSERRKSGWERFREVTYIQTNWFAFKHNDGGRKREKERMRRERDGMNEESGGVVP